MEKEKDWAQQRVQMRAWQKEKMVKYSETDFVSGRNIDAEDFLSHFAKTSEFANML